VVEEGHSGCVLRGRLFGVGNAVEDLFLLRPGAIDEIVIEVLVALGVEPDDPAADLGQEAATPNLAFLT